MKIFELKNIIEKILDNNKARDIISIDLKNKSYIADYMIIASGNSSRHLQALSEILLNEMKKKGLWRSSLTFSKNRKWMFATSLAVSSKIRY